MIGVLLAILGRLLPVPAAARGVGEIAVAISSPAGELMAPSHYKMSQPAWYQNRGPASCVWQHGRMPYVAPVISGAHQWHQLGTRTDPNPRTS